MEEFKNQNSTNDLFNADGLRIDPNEPISKEKLQKISSLESTDPTTDIFVKKPELELKNDIVSNTQTKEQFKT